MHAWNCRSELQKGLASVGFFLPDGRGTALFHTAGSGPSDVKCSPTGWFGPKCRYKCHCDSDTVQCHEKTGDCTQPGRCRTGWFGPACQFRIAPTTLPSWATDNKPETCYSSGHQSIVAKLSSPQRLTWLLLGGPSSAHLNEITVQYSVSGINKKCPEPRKNITTKISAIYFTREVFCPVKDVIEHVTLSGSGLAKLCSVEISMGRNVALKQRIFYDSSPENASYHLWPVRNAVDGIKKTSKTLDAKGDECSDGTTFPVQTKIFLLFDTPVELSAMFVYFRLVNRQKGCCSKSMGTKVTFWGAGFQPMISHEIGEYRKSKAYSVVPVHLSSPVHMVTIEKLDQFAPLSLCEIEAYGDCAIGKYGTQCQQDCNCNSGKSCSPTGQCLEECPSGYYGNSCQNNTEGPNISVMVGEVTTRAQALCEMATRPFPGAYSGEAWRS
ncbi:tyrosine-protein kinase receptor tie-1 [Plakobranchus ocellatus]|uniref:Tyrosine-protein kinase receptor tie-1 n=1 Tax=Plakobranchus ocellatus TaxID=259542 RepID=A0AAV3ZTV2_9GAST|nr:tyrosine-protein kinase receptor tie-1 [Plakobranchus ocellatus]